MSGPRPGGVPPFMGGPLAGLDAASGMVGPAEAVQGRSLKSYEDLDAAGDKGITELDY